MKILFAYFDTSFHPSGMPDLTLFIKGTTTLPHGMGCVRAYAEADPVLGPASEMSNMVLRFDAEPAASAREILSRAPDLAAFGCYVWNRDRTMETCRLLKAGRPGMKIVIGGPELPRDPALLLEFLAAKTYIDAAVFGEGELTFAEAVRSFMGNGPELKDIPGLAYRERASWRVNAPRPSLEELGRIPSPYLSGALEVLPGGTGFVGLETSRGCPLRCSFCDYHTGAHKIRCFPLERFSAEIALLQEKGFSGNLQIVDPALNADRDRTRAVLKALRSYDGRVALDMSPVLMDDELISDFARIPRPIAFLGIQTINPRANRDARRGINVLRASETIRKLLDTKKIHVLLELILGLPGDDLEGFKRTVDWALSFRPFPTIYFFDLEVLPNAEFHATKEKFKLVVDSERMAVSNYTFSADELRSAARLVSAYNSIYYGDTACVDVFERAVIDGGLRPSSLLERVGARMLSAGLVADRRLYIHKTEGFVRLDPSLIREAAADEARPRPAARIGAGAVGPDLELFDFPERFFREEFVPWAAGMGLTAAARTFPEGGPRALEPSPEGTLRVFNRIAAGAAGWGGALESLAGRRIVPPAPIGLLGTGAFFAAIADAAAKKVAFRERWPKLALGWAGRRDELRRRTAGFRIACVTEGKDAADLLASEWAWLRPALDCLCELGFTVDAYGLGLTAQVLSTSSFLIATPWAEGSPSLVAVPDPRALAELLDQNGTRLVLRPPSLADRLPTGLPPRVGPAAFSWGIVGAFRSAERLLRLARRAGARSETGAPA